jgi:hypothetical protein
MTGVALLNRITNLLRNQNHESNGGFPLHPSLKIAIWVNKKGFCNGPLVVNPSSTCDILSPGLASVRGRRMAAT